MFDSHATTSDLNEDVIKADVVTVNVCSFIYFANAVAAVVLSQ